jgi:F-type H+-transporting ATPase subunit delta
MAQTLAVSRRYARALFEAAQGPAKARLWLEQLKNLSATWDLSNDLSRALLSPAFSLEERHKVLDAVCLQLGLVSELRNLLKVMLDADRLSILPDLCLQVEDMVQHADGIAKILVETALPLSEEQNKVLKALLENRVGSRVDIQTQVRPELLAGLRVQWRGMTWDATLGAELSQMKQTLLKRV